MKDKRPILEKLKEEWEGWKLSVIVRNSARNSSKLFVKRAEKELREAKRVLYLTTKQWREAREMEKKTKAKFKGFVSQRRSWAKHNLGKVLTNMEKVE
jgi:hypothetical protein